VNVKRPHIRVVLDPLKSLLCNTSSELKCKVPVSVGSKEPGSWVMAPARLNFLEKYFLGVKEQPEHNKQTRRGIRTT